jgi:hypothetical protein
MISNMDESQQLDSSGAASRPFFGRTIIAPHSNLSHALEADSTVYSGSMLAPPSGPTSFTKESPQLKPPAAQKKFKLTKNARRAVWIAGGTTAAILTAYAVEHSTVKTGLRDIKQSPTGQIPLTTVAPAPAVI